MHIQKVHVVGPMCMDAQVSAEQGERKPTFGMSEMWERNVEDATGTGGGCDKSFYCGNRSI